MAPWRKSRGFVVCGYFAILLLSLASCGGSLYGEFVFDDTEAIINNNDVNSNNPLINIFQNDFWGTKLTHNQSHKSYRPLTVLTFRLNYWISGRLVSWTFHLVNIVLHSIVCLLLWSVYCAILGNDKELTSLWACCLFAVHPIHTEAVCGIVGRADVLAALFFLLSFLTYSYSSLLASGFGGIKGCAWLILSIIFAAAAMFSKEHGITVLGFNLAYEILHVQKLNIRVILKQHGMVKLRVLNLLRGCVVLASLFILLYLRCLLMDFRSPTFQKVDNPASFEESWLARTLSLNYIACLNVWLLVCPDWLCFDWSMGCIAIIRNLTDARVLLPIACWITFSLLFITASLSRHNATQRDIFLSLCLLIIPFVPASNVLFRVGFVVAERILYIPSAGFCLLIALGMERLFYKKDLTFPFGLLLFIFLIKSHVRSLDWRSEAPLFSSALRVCPANAKVRYNVAKSAADRGYIDRAISEYREAIILFPEYDQALNNLANLIKNRGELNEAEKLLKKALKIRTDFPAAWMNLGIVLASLKRYSEAEKAYLAALKQRKHYSECYYNMGNLYLEQNRLVEAEEAWMNATKLNPSMSMAWNNLIMVKDNHGNHTGAIAVAKEAINSAGDVASFHFNMANAYGKLSEFETAEKYFKNALELDPKNALYYGNLGVLYHRWKKLTQAEKAYLNALRLNPKLSSAKTNYNMLKKSKKKEN